MPKPHTISALLRSLIENEPGKTCRELALLANHPLTRTHKILANMLCSGKLVSRYSAESLEAIYFVPGETTMDYHPSTLAEAKLQQARFKARVTQHIIKVIYGQT